MYGGIAGYFVAPAPPAPAAAPLPVGQLTGGTGPPVPPAPACQAGGSNRAIAYFRQRLREIRNHHPTHEMFGAIQSGVLVMPFHDQARANSVCWYNAIDSVCSKPMRLNLQCSINQCWMTKSSSYKINKPKAGGGTTLCKSFKAVRFFAFLMNPTDANWNNLRDGQETRPFDHWCGRGEATDAAQNGYVCINGMEHGDYSSRAANEERKQCKNGARVLCPGHGRSLTKCVFTHPDGTARPCRNNPTQVPVCACQPACY